MSAEAAEQNDVVTKNSHLKPLDHNNMVDNALMYAYDKTDSLIRTLQTWYKHFKINLTIAVEVFRVDEFGNDLESEILYVKPDNGFDVHQTLFAEKELRQCFVEIDARIANFVSRGSGWIVRKPLYLEASCTRVALLYGQNGTEKTQSAEMNCCELHTMQHQRNHGLAPSHNGPIGDGGICFFLAVAAGLYTYIMGKRETNKERLLSFLRDYLDMSEEELFCEAGPMTVDRVGKFENIMCHAKPENPKIGITVVYRDEEGFIMPMRANKRTVDFNIVIVLFHTIKTDSSVLFDPSKEQLPLAEEDISLHYAFVEDPVKLLAHRVRKVRRKKGEEEGGAGAAASTEEYTVKVNKFICWNCFQTQRCQASHKKHLEVCLLNDAQEVVMPNPGETLSFKNQEKADAKSFKSAFILAFDFESLQVPTKLPCSCNVDITNRTQYVRHIDHEVKRYLKDASPEFRAQYAADLAMEAGQFSDVYENAKVNAELEGKKFKPPKPPKPQKLCPHKTQTMKEQPPFAYSLALLDRNRNVLEYKTYVGEDAAENFVLTVLQLADHYLPMLSPGMPIEDLSPEYKALLYDTTDCYLCGEHMDRSERVLDHDHLTSEFLGVAHNECNLRRRESVTMSCFCHNFSNYDSHFIVRALNSFPDRIWKLRGIPLNSQKFKCFTVNERISFLDSVSFLPNSLDGLVNVLKKSDCSFSMVKDVMADTEEELNLLTRKGVYPYSFATSIDALRNAEELPSIEHFYNDMEGEDCDPKDYEHAREVWKKFDCKNMLDYTSLYCLSDVMLLSEVVMDARDNMWNLFGLDMAKYLSLPHMSLDIMLKTTGAEIELLSDLGMCNAMMNNIRGGHSFVNLRHSRAKNWEEMNPIIQVMKNQIGGTGGVEPTPRSLRKHLKSITYLDANNLYGKAMSFPLPYSDFRWLTGEEIAKFDPLKDITDVNGPGYILEVDLEYPSHLHQKHSDFPLCPENLTILGDDLSPITRRYMLNLPQHKNLNSYRSEKLTSTLYNRERYWIHGLNLKLALEQGLILTKIHSVIGFKQKDFMRPFIEMCTSRRIAAAEAGLESVAMMWKLVANSVYGKLIENSSKREDCYFTTSEAQALRRAGQPTFKGFMVCDENLSISFHKKKRLKMRQCWALGFSILEISKYWMQHMYYDKIVPKLGGHDNVRVIMSDTDSFLLEVREKTDVEVMLQLAEIMDFSNFKKNHILYSEDRAKVPGYMKNEMPKTRITEAVAVKAKAWAVKTEHNQNQDVPAEARAKGVKRSVTKKLSFSHFLDCIENRVSMLEVFQRTLISKKHTNFMIEARRVAFSPADDKRAQTCNRHSVPYGSVHVNYLNKGGSMSEMQFQCPQCTADYLRDSRALFADHLDDGYDDDDEHRDEGVHSELGSGSEEEEEREEEEAAAAEMLSIAERESFMITRGGLGSDGNGTTDTEDYDDDDGMEVE